MPQSGLHGQQTGRWTEEYQESIYQHQLPMLNRIPQLRGMSPWILMDFHSPRRMLPGIQDGFNRKGLISDQGEKKKAFFLLPADSDKLLPVRITASPFAIKDSEISYGSPIDTSTVVEEACFPMQQGLKAAAKLNWTWNLPPLIERGEIACSFGDGLGNLQRAHFLRRHIEHAEADEDISRG